MIRIDFTEEAIKKLHYERYHHPHPRVQVKMETLLLKSKKLPHKEICRIMEISESRLCRYLKEYIQGGIDRLKEVRFYKPKSDLVVHQGTLREYFMKHPPVTVNEASERIAELTGVRRKPTQIRKFLKTIGMKLRKVGMIPAKADVEAQESFKIKELEPRLEEAKAGSRHVFFVDAAHFVLAAYLGCLWCFERLFIKAPPGRQRFNILAALDAITNKMITVTNDSYINAQSVCDLLHKLRCLYADTPITLVLDNARYQRCLLVQALAESLNIELLYLPPYSPNLNLIERVWKFIKKECLYSKYHADFSKFKSTISDCIDQMPTTHKTKLRSLLSLNFQTFKNVSVMAA